MTRDVLTVVFGMCVGVIIAATVGGLPDPWLHVAVGALAAGYGCWLGRK